MLPQVVWCSLMLLTVLSVVDCSLMLSVLLPVLWCFRLFSGVLTVLSSLDIKMSRSPAWSLLSSSFKPSFLFFLFLFLFFWAIQPIQTLFIIFPLPQGGLKKKFFLNIRGRQVAGGSSDLLGCVCVGGPFSLPLSLFTLYLLIVTISS